MLFYVAEGKRTVLTAVGNSHSGLSFFVLFCFLVCFTIAATDKFDTGNELCICAIFRFIIVRKGGKAKDSFGTIKHFFS